MGRKIRIILVFFLIICGSLFFYLYYQKITKPKSPKTHWKFKETSKKSMPAFLCLANVYYTFETTGKISTIKVDNIQYNINNINNIFHVKFNKNTYINTIYYRFSGTWFKTGYIEIRRDIQYGQRLVLLSTNNYTDTIFKVNKGMRFDIPWPEEKYTVGYFKDSVKKFELNIRECKSYGCFEWFRFWEDYDIKFKAIDVDFFLSLRLPYDEKLDILSDTSRKRYGHHTDRKIKLVPRAYYLKKGEVLITPFWLDIGDKIEFIQTIDRRSDNIYFEKKRWFEFRNYYFANVKKLNNKGYIKIKAESDCVIRYVKVIHRSGWTFNLKKGEIYKIKIYPNDLLKSLSRENYYLDGEILEPNTVYYISRPYETFLEFKGGPNTKKIDVWVVSRRGY